VRIARRLRWSSIRGTGTAMRVTGTGTGMGIGGIAIIIADKLTPLPERSG